MQPNNKNGGPEVGNALRSENRAYETRRDNDDVKSYAVTLETIDSVILNHINGMPIDIINNNSKIKVPVIFASPERWKSIRVDGYIRDQNGKIQRPIMTINRSGFSQNDQLAAFNRELQYTYIKRFSEKNKFNQYGILTGKYQKAPVQEIYSVTMPDHIIVNYDCVVWTDRESEMNSIIEKINFSVNDYWGDKKTYRFRVNITDFSTEITSDSGQDRIVKSTFSLNVNAYLRPNSFENGKSIIQKMMTPRKVSFGVEFDENRTNTIAPDDSIFVDPNKHKKFKD